MKLFVAALVLGSALSVSGLAAQRGASQSRDTVSAPTPTKLTDSPQVFNIAGQPVRVVAMKGLSLPWALAILPSGDILVTEQMGALRLIHDGKVDPQPIAGMPEVNKTVPHGGLYDIALHPKYAENHYIYFTYAKTAPGGPFEDFGWNGIEKTKVGKRHAATVALVRAKYEGGHALTDIKEIFLADAASQGSAQGRLIFAKDGKIILTIGQPTRHAVGTPEDAQNPANHGGKILRLNDDGTVPQDNPFVNRKGYRPEIYAMGIRNALGLYLDQTTGQIWETENGPMGGDEINLLKPGANYGWPTISYGRDYRGEQLGGLSGTTTYDRRREGMEEPFMIWLPSPSLAGLLIYTGDKFPTLKGNLLVATLGGSNLGARMIQRVVLNRQGLPQRQGIQPLLGELQQRMRDIKQGPDGLIYITTDEQDGAVLRLEPAGDSVP